MLLGGLRYVWYFSPLERWVAWVYAPLAYVGHLNLLAYLLLMALLVIVLMLIPRPLGSKLF